MSSSKTALSNLFSIPIAEFQYRQLIPSSTIPAAPIQAEEKSREQGQWLSEEDLRGRLAAAARVRRACGRRCRKNLSGAPILPGDPEGLLCTRGDRGGATGIGDCREDLAPRGSG
jgi:hypothetical protein